MMTISIARVGVATILLAGCFFTTASSSAALVTATSSGTFDDLATWTAVATWDDSFMADTNVTVAEMTSFDVVTTAGPNHFAATYDLSEANGLSDGFDFAGTTPSSPLNGTIGFNDYFEATDAITFQRFVHREAPVFENDATFSEVRIGNNNPVWSITAVPEPSTVMLLSLAASCLVGSGGRRRRRRR